MTENEKSYPQSQYAIYNSTLSGIGSALRYKLNTNDLYKISDMPNAINSIRTLQKPLPSSGYGIIVDFPQTNINQSGTNYRMCGEVYNLSTSAITPTDSDIKISSPLGTYNIYCRHDHVDEKGIPHSIIFSDTAAAYSNLYFGSSVNHLPEYFDGYSKTNKTFLSTIYNSEINLANLYNLGFYNVERIHKPYLGYTRSWNGLDKLRITDLTGFMETYLTAYNTDNGNYFNFIPTFSGGSGQIMHNTYSWCGPYVRNLDGFYNHTATGVESYLNTIGYGDNLYEAHCGQQVASLIATYEYQNNIVKAEVGEKVFTAYYAYAYCYNLQYVKVNGSTNNELTNLAIGYHMFYMAGYNNNNTTVFLDFNINTPYIYNYSYMYAYSRINRTPDIIGTTNVLSINPFYDMCYGINTITHIGNFGDLIIPANYAFPNTKYNAIFNSAMPTNIGYIFDGCNFYNLNHGININSITYERKGQLRLSYLMHSGFCNIQPMNDLVKVGDVVSNGSVFIETLLGYISSSSSYSTLRNITEAKNIISFGNIIAEKEINLRMPLDYSVSSYHLGEPLKRTETCCQFGDIISNNSNIIFNEFYTLAMPISRVDTMKDKEIVSCKIGNIIANNGVFNGSLIGYLGDVTYGWKIKNIIAKDINIQNFLLYHQNRAELNNLKSFAEIDTLQAKNNIYLSTPSGSSDSFKQNLNNFYSINLIKSDNITIHKDWGTVGINYSDKAKKIVDIKMIEGNNIIINSIIPLETPYPKGGENHVRWSSDKMVSVNLKASNYINIGYPDGIFGYGSCGLNINIYYSKSEKFTSPSIDFYAGLSRKFNPSLTKWIIRLEKSSPYNSSLYNDGYFNIYGGFFEWNESSNRYEAPSWSNSFSNGIGTWTMLSNGYCNKEAGIYVYCDL